MSRWWFEGLEKGSLQLIALSAFSIIFSINWRRQHGNLSFSTLCYNFSLLHSFPLFLAASYPNTGSHGARIHVCTRCKTVVIGWSMAASAGSPTVWRPVSLSSSPMPIPAKDIEALTKKIKTMFKGVEIHNGWAVVSESDVLAEQFRLQASQRLWWTRITKVYRSARRLTRVIRKTSCSYMLMQFSFIFIQFSCQFHLVGGQVGHPRLLHLWAGARGLPCAKGGRARWGAEGGGWCPWAWECSSVRAWLKVGGNATDATAVLFAHIWWIPQPRVWESDLYAFN